MKDLKEIEEIIALDDAIGRGLRKLWGVGIRFPEVESESPFKLGVFYDATVKLGYDNPQPNKLLLATVSFGAGGISPPSIKSKRALWKSIELILHSSKKEGTAFTPDHNSFVSPKLSVLYPSQLGGYALTPTNFFKWWGKERLIVTQMRKCDERDILKFFPNAGPYDELAWAATGYTGREFDGMSVLR